MKNRPKTEKVLPVRTARKAPWVLVVDGDARARDEARLALERSGLRVFTSGSSTEARGWVAKHGLDLDAMVYDVGAGDLHVAAAVDLLCEMSPAPVIVTGAAEDGETARAIRPVCDVKAFLQKPYSGDDLVGAVARAVRSGRAARGVSEGPRARYGIAHRS